MFAGTTLAQQPLASGLDKANMDLTVKPGADFYRYATGGWCDVHPLTAEYARYSQFEALNENNHKQLRELIENWLALSPGHGQCEAEPRGLRPHSGYAE